MSPPPPLLDVQEATIGYDGLRAVEEATLSLEPGEIGCLLGPSGCGKSTLLRGIAGFEPLGHGTIGLGGRVLSSAGHTISPEHRRIGMMFQDVSLFPHLTVEGNVTFGLRGSSREAQRARVAQLLELVGLPGFQRRYPHSLSGGEQQRIALARAMAPGPDVLLLDEPFSSLDVELREALAPEVRTVLQRENVTAILVTHDQQEAFAMADRIGVMAQGRILQWDSGFRLYHEPKSRFVADFVGRGTFLRAQVTDERAVECSLGTLRAQRPHRFGRGATVDVLIRPDDVLHDDASRFTGEVVSKNFRGSHFLYRVLLASGERVICLSTSHEEHTVGDRIGISLHLDHLVMFPRESG